MLPLVANTYQIKKQAFTPAFLNIGYFQNLSEFRGFEFIMKSYHLSSVYRLTPQILDNIGVTCLLLDVDNTIRKYSEIEPSEKTKRFISQMHSAGIKIILCSNNFKDKIKPYAESLECDFVSFSLKPSPFGMVRAWVKSKAKHKDIMVIGDQVFNDILAGKLMGFKTLLVSPIDSENEPSTVTARRRLFKFFEKKILDNKNPFQEVV